MKKTIKFIGIVAAAAAAVLLASCEKETAKSYKLTINLSLPEGVTVADIHDITAEAVKGSKTYEVRVEAVETQDATGASVESYTGTAKLTQGDYKFSVNGTISSAKTVVGAAEVSLYEDTEISVELSVVVESPLLIKAFQYTPGKQYYIQPLSDTWIEIVNNSDEVQYLDQIILIGGMGGQKQANAWQANGYANLYGGATQSPVFAFPGKGTDYPLQPGKSVVIANAPINHQAQGEGFENCADLSKADWEFYCSYNSKDTDYEGIPNLDFIFTSFTSQANWGQGFFSNGAMLVKLPEGITPAAYVAKEENLMTTPGTTSKSQYVMFPNSYVLDAVDIWDGTEEEHYPVFLPVDDAQGIIGAAAWSGQGVRRKVTKIENGRAYYKDTNNSSKDFVVAKLVPGAEPTAVDAE